MDDGEHWLKLFFNESRNEKRDPNSWDIIIYFSTFPGITHIAPLLLRDTLQLISSEPFHLVDFINGNVRSTPAKKRKRASFEEKPLNIRYTDEWHRIHPTVFGLSTLGEQLWVTTNNGCRVRLR